MQLSQLVAIAPALQALASTKLPAKSAYRIAKCVNLIQPELRLYDEQRMKLAQEFGKQDGDQYKFEPEGAAAFSAAMQTLLDETVTLDLPTVTIDDLGTAEIEPGHLAALDGLIIK